MDSWDLFNVRGFSAGSSTACIYSTFERVLKFHRNRKELIGFAGQQSSLCCPGRHSVSVLSGVVDTLQWKNSEGSK